MIGFLNKKVKKRIEIWLFVVVFFTQNLGGTLKIEDCFEWRLKREYKKTKRVKNVLWWRASKITIFWPSFFSGVTFLFLLRDFRRFIFYFLKNICTKLDLIIININF